MIVEEEIANETFGSNKQILDSGDFQTRYEILKEENRIMAAKLNMAMEEINQLKLFKHVLDQLPVCTIIYDQTEKVIYRNRHTENVDGYSDMELLGLTRKEYLQRLRIKPGKKIKKVSPDAKDGKFIDGIFGMTETSLQRADGSTTGVLLSGNFVYGDSREFLGACGTAVDVSDYILEQSKADRSLREQAAFMQRLIDTIPNPIFYKDAEGYYQVCNSAFCDLVGLAKQDVIGKTAHDLFVPELAQRYHEMDLLLSGKLGVQVYESLVKHADGSLHNVIFYKASYANDDDNAAGVVGVIVDITERKQMEREMERFERLKLLGEMAAGIGHEIRNPLTTVRGFLQMLGGKDDCSRYSEYFSLMISELDRANAIITEYLSIARERESGLSLQNLNTIIDRLTPLIKSDVTNSDMDLYIAKGDVSDIHLEEKEIRQLILNLVRNGIEAMTPGGTLTIRTFNQGDEVVLSVGDQGKGIMPDIIDKIGTPFLTTKSSGTGLGLATCYGIAGRHSAKISVKSGPEGTTFYVHFKNVR